MWDDVINKDGWLHWLATNDPILSKSIFVDSTCFIWGTLTSLTRFNKAHHVGQVRRKNLAEAGRREPCAEHGASGTSSKWCRSPPRAATWRRRPSTILRCWSVWWRCGQKQLAKKAASLVMVKRVSLVIIVVFWIGRRWISLCLLWLLVLGGIEHGRTLKESSGCWFHKFNQFFWTDPRYPRSKRCLW